MKLKNPLRDLTNFERMLWLFSVGAIVISSFFAQGRVLTVIASLIGVTALIFVAKGYVVGQVFTVAFSVFYGTISFFFRYYGEMITYLGMTTPMAVCAVISWLRHPYKDTREVEVHRLTRGQVVAMLMGAAVTTVVFYFILDALGNANLLASTVSVTTSFAASYLTFFRSPYYALAYAANDMVLVLLWVLAAVEDASYVPMVVCFLMFFANDVYGFCNWRRMQQRQSKKTREKARK
ncbi:MAG: nicotinamide mononucleotide transporter [Clostridia bacterium]|nr:nicotinamide mononucleotide transporter [Clostridia bacterium]